MKKSEQRTEEKETCVSKTKSNGLRCQTMPVDGSPYCFFHDPAKRTERKAAQQRGGRANSIAVLPLDAADVPLNSGKDVAAFLAETINQVRKGRVSQDREHRRLSFQSVNESARDD